MVHAQSDFIEYSLVKHNFEGGIDGEGLPPSGPCFTLTHTKSSEKQLRSEI